MMGTIDDLVDLSRKLKDLPPIPHAVMTHHAVPYGRAYRQWDTKGRLLIWANRGELADMPRGTAPRPPVFGIPVYNA